MEKIRTPDQQRHIPRFHDELMTYQEYARLKHPRPYEYRLTAKDEEIIFFGPGHSNDPSDPAFQRIREHIIAQKPNLVIVEGMRAINNASPTKLKRLAARYTDDEAIEQIGENFFTAKLALEQDMKVISPEPDDAAAVHHLEQLGFSREVILAQRISSLIAQYDRARSKPSFEEYLVPHFQRMSDEFGWHDFELSLNHFRAIHQNIFKTPFDLENVTLYKEACDPVPWKGKEYRDTNRVAAAWSEFRDRFIVDAIQDLLDQYKKIFIVYGASHAVIQEPALRKLMQYRAEHQKIT